MACLLGCGEPSQSTPIESCTQVYTQAFCDSITGERGKDGQSIQGESGRDGATGQEGEVGMQGLPGDNGIDGQSGINGANGVPGEPGQDGRDGIDGKECWVECIDKLNVLITCPESIVTFKVNKCEVI